MRKFVGLFGSLGKYSWVAAQAPALNQNTLDKASLSRGFNPGALGGTLNGDPCSLLGEIGVLPGYIKAIQGLYKGYIRYWD